MRAKQAVKEYVAALLVVVVSILDGAALATGIILTATKGGEWPGLIVVSSILLLVIFTVLTLAHLYDEP